MRSWILGWFGVALLCTAIMGAAAEPVEQPPTTSAPAGEECAGPHEQLVVSKAVLTERGSALQERLDAVAAALGEIEAHPDAVPATELTDRKQAMVGEQVALQNELKFLESTETAWQAALDACEKTVRFREELEHFRAARDRGEVKFVSGDVAAIRAQLEPLESARAALLEQKDACAKRLGELGKELENAEEQSKRLLEAEQASLQAEAQSVRHKLAARDAEHALLESKLAAAREIVGDSPTTEPAKTTTAPAADEADAINKQRIAERLNAEARNKLEFARSELERIESTLKQTSAEERDTAQLENERELWKRVEEHEQHRIEHVELHKRDARQTEAIGQVRQRIDKTKENVSQLKVSRAKMTPQDRRKHADQYKKKAEQTRKEADAMDERAKTEQKEIEPLQQLLPGLDAVEQALDERLQEAETTSFTEYQQMSRHVRDMRKQLDAERQLINLMIATTKNVVYGKMWQATRMHELADLHMLCAEVLVPTVPSFWERQRKIIHSIGIVAVAIAVTYAVRLAIWLILRMLASLKSVLGGARFSVKRIGTLAGFAGSMLKLFVWIFAVVAILNEFGIDPAKSTGAIGLIGLIMAGMFQQIVVDFVKGLDIIAGRHYNVGDFVELDGKTGHVVDFNIKHTRIRTPSGQEINIPNSRCVPSRRFPDGFVDNYVDVVLKSRADADRAKAAIDAICPDLNQRIEPIRMEPSLTNRFTCSRSREVLRYRVRVLPGCDWVAKDHFVPAATEALAQEEIEMATVPNVFFINRVETFRKLFNRRLSEEEIVGEVSNEPPSSDSEINDPHPTA